MSCIIAVFNGERRLAEAIDSALAQTHPLETIVVDDGSIDGTPEVLAAYGSRIRRIRQDNAGPAAAMNRGIETARGEFLAFLDADDRWAPRKLALQLERMRSEPGLVACFGQVENFWDDDLTEERRRMADHRIRRPVPGLTHSTLLARRRAFVEIGPFDEGLLHGYSVDWVMRLRDRGLPHTVLEDVLLFRRYHGENRSRYGGRLSREEVLRLLKARLDRRREIG